MERRAGVIRRLVALGLFLGGVLGAQAGAVELGAIAQGNEQVSQRADRWIAPDQPAAVAAAEAVPTQPEESVPFVTASLTGSLDSTGPLRAGAARVRTVELELVSPRSSLHLGVDGPDRRPALADRGSAGTAGRSFVCDVRILPLAEGWAGAETADGLVLMAF